MRRSTQGTWFFLLASLLCGVLGLRAITAPPSAAAVPVWPVEEVPLPASFSNYPVITVVLDAGHGGAQPGACYFGEEERFITFDVTMLLKTRLEELGYTILLTRSGDDDIDLYARAAMANDVNADLFISVHANVSDGYPDVQGVMTYVQPGKEGGRLLGEAIHAQLLLISPGKDYGVHDEDLAVLRETTMPAVLAEIGFMTNQEELSRLTDPDYQSATANAIAAGVVDYLTEYPVSIRAPV